MKHDDMLRLLLVSMFKFKNCEKYFQVDYFKNMTGIKFSLTLTFWLFEIIIWRFLNALPPFCFFFFFFGSLLKIQFPQWFYIFMILFIYVSFTCSVWPNFLIESCLDRLKRSQKDSETSNWHVINSNLAKEDFEKQNLSFW